MRTLVVGAGAVGGYLGANWRRAGRDVTFLVRPATAARLRDEGVRIRGVDGSTSSVEVPSVTRENLVDRYDVVVVAVRAAGVGAAADDVAPAVGDATLVVPVANGVAPVEALSARFGPRVLGGVAKLATSLCDGVVVETARGASVSIGALDSDGALDLDGLAAEFSAGDVVATVDADIVAALWSKFAFIAATTTLTCLARGVIGDVADTPGGPALATQVLAEVCSVALAAGQPLSEGATGELLRVLTDPGSRFAPSMFRDLTAARPVEVDVLAELASRARSLGVATALVDAAVVALELHNRVTTGRDS